MNSFRNEFITQCIYRLNENTSKIKTCLEELNEEELWQRPNESSNSVGNMLLHLCGNIRQYAISSLKSIPDIRERDLEFSTNGGYSKEELLNQLSETVDEAISIIKAADENSLLKQRSVQGFNLTGIGIITHVTEHYSYHSGQIIYRIKQLKNKEFDLYKGVDLNLKNKNSQ